MQYKIAISKFGSTEHRDDLNELSSRGIAIPHHYRFGASGGRQFSSFWCRVIDTLGHPISGFAFSVFWTRSLPGARSIRIERVGRSLHEPIAASMGSIIREVSAHFTGVLRLHVELFDENDERRELLQRSLVGAGGLLQQQSRGYAQTLRTLVDSDPEQLFKTLSANTRRDIRSTVKSGAKVGPVLDPLYVDRLDELYRQSFLRTAAAPPPADFRAIQQDAATQQHSVLLGVFWPTRTPPNDLVAFVWGRAHGDFVGYDIGASERAPDLGIVPLSYSLLWELICWSHRKGCRWFDFGGITPADAPSDHPLRGISAFKLRFTSDRVDVGSEVWIEPNAFLSFASRAITRIVK
jgi:hypothetical protein